MEGKISVLESVLNKLSLIPGLNFLATYVTDARMVQTQVEQTIGDYQSYVDAAKEAAQETAGAFDDDGEAEDEDDEEEEEEEL